MRDMPEPVLGRPGVGPSEQIDTFHVMGSVNEIMFESTELSAICPVTNGPDLYDMTIRYTPSLLCIETKSLKLYLETFRNRGIFAEHLAPEMANHLSVAVKVPVHVTLRQHTRGGIVTTVSATSDPVGRSSQPTTV